MDCGCFELRSFLVKIHKKRNKLATARVSRYCQLMPLPKNVLSLTHDLTTPALPDMEIARLARLTDASPEEFSKAMASLFRRLALEGFRTIQAPRNYKELATVIDLWRKLEGLDKQDKGAAMPAGLVGVLRSVQRRPVMDAETVEDDAVGFD